jgi:glyoxylase-like metal-dependent hydrolase (beta-lactamase superfamily II)
MQASRPTKSEHYAFEDLDEGVTFGRARPEGTALSNTGIVDLGKSTLIFDTSLTLHSAREIRGASLERTGRAPSLAANSHWHLDHIVGNPIFADRPIYATQRTIEILLEKRAELEGEFTREKLESDIRELERQRKATTTDAGRTQYDTSLRINRALLEEVAELKLVPPSQGFETELKLPGDRDARLLTFGAGHTESDAMLFLGKSRILFSGDLVVAETHPNLQSGDPEHWLTVLDKIEGLRPERIVTGHGPLGSPETVAVMRDYLSTVLELARAPGEPEVPQRFRAWTEPDQFTGNIAYVRQRWAGQR